MTGHPDRVHAPASRRHSRPVIAAAILCFVAGVACQAAVNVVFPTPVPSLTPTPCPGSGIVFSQRVDDVLINAYCGVNQLQATQVADYARYGLEHMPEDVDPALTMFVFTNPAQGVDLELQWRNSMGYSPVPRERLLEEWNDYTGRAYEDAIFILLRDGIGSHSRSASVARTVLHEVHHLAQFQLWHDYAVEADWLTEGGADAVANRQLVHLGFSALSLWQPVEQGCEFSLSELARRTSDVPVDCVYDEGEKAVSLLVDQCGEDAYYQVFRESLVGRSLSAVFQRVYPFSLEDFYTAFDKYRLSGYSAKPVLCTEPVLVQPTGTPAQ